MMRDSGKTEAMAQWIAERARLDPPGARFHVIAATSWALETFTLRVLGLCKDASFDRATRTLTWPNGTQAQLELAIDTVSITSADR